MKIIKRLLPLIILLGFQTNLVSQLDIFKKYYHKRPQIKPRSVNSIHFSFGTGYSFHYLNPISRRSLNQAFRSQTKLKQKPDQVIHFNFSINHLLSPKQEIFFGIGISEYGFQEEGEFTILFTSPSSTYEQSYSTSKTFEYLSFFIGHRYIFPSKTNRYLFLENSLTNDWMQDYSFNENDFINRSGFSYQFKFGRRVIYREKRKALFSIYYRTAIVKYNLQKFDKNYYPFAFGIDLAMALSFKK